MLKAEKGLLYIAILFYVLSYTYRKAALRDYIKPEATAALILQLEILVAQSLSHKGGGNGGTPLEWVVIKRAAIVKGPGDAPLFADHLTLGHSSRVGAVLAPRLDIFSKQHISYPLMLMFGDIVPFL